MACTFDREKLTAFYDGECDATETAEVEFHIASCSVCLRELGEMKQTSASVKTLPRVAAPPSILEAVQKEIRTAAPAAPPSTSPGASAPEFRQAPRGLQWFISVAAVALVAASVVIISNRQEQPAPRPEAVVAQDVRKQAGTPGPEKVTETPIAAKPKPDVMLGPDSVAGRSKIDDLRKKISKEFDKSELEKLDGKPGIPPEPLSPPSAPAKPTEKSGDNEESSKREEKPREVSKSADEDRARKESQERMMARGMLPKPDGEKAPAIEVLAISAKDMAQTRAGVEKLLEKLDRAVVVGSATLGDDSYVKDHYVEVELSESEYQALVRDLQLKKAGVEKTDSEHEAKRLKEQLAMELAKVLSEEGATQAPPVAPTTAEKPIDQKKEKAGKDDTSSQPAPGAPKGTGAAPDNPAGGSGGAAERKAAPETFKKPLVARRKIIIAFREPAPAAKK